MLLNFIFTVIAFAAGYMLCLRTERPEKFRRALDIPRVRKPTIGVIDRPTASDLNRRGTVEEQGDEATAKLLIKAGLKPKL